MTNNTLYERKHYYITFVYTMVILILGNLLNEYITLLMGLIAWGLVYYFDKSKYNLNFILFRYLILALPLSFINIFGESYGRLPVSWFNVFLLILSIYFLYLYIFKYELHLNSLSLMAIFLSIISIIPVILSSYFLEALNQYLNLVITFIMIVIGNNIKYDFNQNEKYELLSDYILTTRIAGIGVVIQYIFLNIFNIEVGNYIFFGNYRHAFGFLFSDFSFLSLYLVSGAIAIIFIKSKHNNSGYKLWIEVLFLLVTSIITSARTGIVSFLIVFILYSLYKLFRYIKTNLKEAIKLMVINIIVLFSTYLLIIRVRGFASLSDSGRMKLNYRGLDQFFLNPILGIGFGDSNYPGTLPHNIIFQSLAQGGIIYTVPIIVFIIMLLWISYKKKPEFLPLLISLFVGAMFIPNIFDSRFMPIIISLFIINIPETYDEFSLNIIMLIKEKFIKKI